MKIDPRKLMELAEKMSSAFEEYLAIMAICLSRSERDEAVQGLGVNAKKFTADTIEALRDSASTIESLSADLEIARAALTDIAAGLHLVESRPRAAEALARLTPTHASAPTTRADDMSCPLHGHK